MRGPLRLRSELILLLPSRFLRSRLRSAPPSAPEGSAQGATVILYCRSFGASRFARSGLAPHRVWPTDPPGSSHDNRATPLSGASHRARPSRLRSECLSLPESPARLPGAPRISRLRRALPQPQQYRPLLHWRRYSQRPRQGAPSPPGTARLPQPSSTSASAIQRTSDHLLYTSPRVRISSTLRIWFTVSTAKRTR